MVSVTQQLNITAYKRASSSLSAMRMTCHMCNLIIIASHLIMCNDLHCLPLLSSCLYVSEQFISPESVMQVNLPAETVREICASLDLSIPASPTILSPAISPRTAEERSLPRRSAINPTPNDLTLVTPTPISGSPQSAPRKMNNPRTTLKVSR